MNTGFSLGIAAPLLALIAFPLGFSYEMLWKVVSGMLDIGN